MAITATQKRLSPSGLSISGQEVNKEQAISTMKLNRTFASFIEARAIKESGWYWISTKGVPTVPGHYPDNVHISEEAATMSAKNDGPLLLIISRGPEGSRLEVRTGDPQTTFAKVASVPLTEADRQAVLARNLRREFGGLKRSLDSHMGKLGELLTCLEHRQ